MGNKKDILVDIFVAFHHCETLCLRFEETKLLLSLESDNFNLFCFQPLDHLMLTFISLLDWNYNLQVHVETVLKSLSDKMNENFFLFLHTLVLAISTMYWSPFTHSMTLKPSRSNTLACAFPDTTRRTSPVMLYCKVLIWWLANRRAQSRCF